MNLKKIIKKKIKRTEYQETLGANPKESTLEDSPKQKARLIRTEASANETPEAVSNGKSIPADVLKALASVGLGVNAASWGTKIRLPKMAMNPTTATPIPKTTPGGSIIYNFNKTVPTFERTPIPLLGDMIHIKKRKLGRWGILPKLLLLPGQEYVMAKSEEDLGNLYITPDKNDPYFFIKLSLGAMDDKGQKNPDEFHINGFDKTNPLARGASVEKQFLSVDTIIAIGKERGWQKLDIDPESSRKFAVMMYYRAIEAGIKPENITGIHPSKRDRRNYEKWCRQAEMSKARRLFGKLKNLGHKSKKEPPENKKETRREPIRIVRTGPANG